MNIFLPFLLACTSTPAPPTPAEAPDGVRVVVLGSGTPVPDPERSGPAIAVVHGSTTWIVDAGPGVVRRAAAAYAAGFFWLRRQTWYRPRVLWPASAAIGLTGLVWTVERLMSGPLLSGA